MDGAIEHEGILFSAIWLGDGRNLGVVSGGSSLKAVSAGQAGGLPLDARQA